MKEDMIKIAGNLVRIVRSKVSSGRVKMENRRAIIDEYDRILKEREKLIRRTRAEIQCRIEQVCRQQSTLIIDDLGFENVSSLLFEDSWQERVVNLLQSDGYHCMMSFSYPNGKLESCLTISWEA